MNRVWIRAVGAALALVGLVFAVVFKQNVHFDMNPQVWFSPAYYLQFIPLYMAVTLLLSGVLVAVRFKGVNFYLAVFGHASSEEILFSLLGWTTSPLPGYAIFLFFPLSLLALLVAYTNVLKARRVSLIEAIFGVVFSTAFILMPRFM
ncbi:hypothetical protein QWI17_01220 [Gilvimarinus sp. SDUM040013]|uniref:Uncharacterized protein n=1 Tax=Gilvimarinus gilvus TaxID=3058038 RepID=A0ABU4S1L7_9GAMM|nr:hypothetical protein [Gilvimarinus sp. SDUM040013]MDO3384451.1 hypothetical protein [Gilvimarinus sp. SDUM040013]MDX6851080.1 hypothetical protein [Gilvimarinus sp. SDUM040013]